ncbi:MAG: rhodanese-like domain-containing protein [Gammaproteobacteria bacterium]|nr:MAG: rhodanese-like domain-containing protein [Gammaproteobacteria bacterium]
MKTCIDFMNDCIKNVEEIFPWDLDELMQQKKDIILLDVREPYEYDKMTMADAINVPRGILENACEWDYEETVPDLVRSRDKKVVIICRSGQRSLWAGLTMKMMGYKNVLSLKTGLKGWNDAELPLFDKQNKQVDGDEAEEYFLPKLTAEQKNPNLN